MPLGVEGFTYADLYSPARLQDLYERFCRDVAAANPEFWAEWDAYRAEPDAPRSPVQVSDLIVRMAPHVSRFVETLFQVNGSLMYVDPQGASTGYDDVFTRIDKARAHYAAVGLGESFVEQFIR